MTVPAPDSSRVTISSSPVKGSRVGSGSSATRILVRRHGPAQAFTQLLAHLLDVLRRDAVLAEVDDLLEGQVGEPGLLELPDVTRRDAVLAERHERLERQLRH